MSAASLGLGSRARRATREAAHAPPVCIARAVSSGMRDLGDSHDIYLVLRPFLGHLDTARSLLHVLGDLDLRHLAGVEGFHRNDVDTALIVLRFTEVALHRFGERTLEVLANRAGLPMVIPSQLATDARREFFLDHLSRYTTYVQLYPGRDPMPLAELVAIHLAEHASAPRARPARHRYSDAFGVAAIRD